jgi:uroporphyrinogen decarboxylase
MFAFCITDPITNMAKEKSAAQGRVTILGMVDPSGVLHRGSPELVAEKYRQAISLVGVGGGFVLGPGCAMSQDTPLDKIETIAVRDRFGVYVSNGTLRG